MLSIQLHAQTTTPATGGTISSISGSVTYSVGQVFYTKNTGSNGSVSQGVIQPFEISTVTGVKPLNISLQYSVYPNPTTDRLILNTGDTKNVSYELFDTYGRILLSASGVNSVTIIDMNQLDPAMYILRVSGNNTEEKSFQIIKK